MNEYISQFQNWMTNFRGSCWVEWRDFELPSPLSIMCWRALKDLDWTEGLEYPLYLGVSLSDGTSSNRVLGGFLGGAELCSEGGAVEGSGGGAESVPSTDTVGGTMLVVAAGTEVPLEGALTERKPGLADSEVAEPSELASEALLPALKWTGDTLAGVKGLVLKGTGEAFRKMGLLVSMPEWPACRCLPGSDESLSFARASLCGWVAPLGSSLPDGLWKRRGEWSH